MKVLFDTSTLVAAMVSSHPHHLESVEWIEKIEKKKIEAYLSIHSLAECYSTLSILPLQPPIAPEQAQLLIKDNILSFFKTVELNQKDYLAAIQRVADKSLRSGSIYDALIYQAAIKKGAKILLTWNKKDFDKISSGEIKIVTPEQKA